VAGCFMVVRRETIASAGSLDEDFFMYGEDEEWCSRIKRAGWRIIYFPGATIIHLHRSPPARPAGRWGSLSACRRCWCCTSGAGRWSPGSPISSFWLA